MRVFNIYTVNITFVVSESAGVLTNTSLGKHWNKGSAAGGGTKLAWAGRWTRWCSLTMGEPRTVGSRQSPGETGGTDSIGSLWPNIMASWVGEYSWSVDG